MKKNIVLIFTIVLSAALSACSAQGNKAITHVYAFGDSFADTGNTMRIAPDLNLWDEVYWQGRYSNGPVPVEVLASRLNAKLTDYAVWGAGTDLTHYWGWDPRLEGTGLLVQIEKFKGELKSKRADSGALYFIMLGGEEWQPEQLTFTPPSSEKLADNNASKIGTAVSRLAELGAKRFLVIQSPNLADTPDFAAPRQKDAILKSAAADYCTLMSAKVSSRMNDLKSQLKVEITLFDYFALSTKMLENPANYGLKNVTEPCQQTYPIDQWSRIAPRCETPDEYYWWDEAHPTRQVNKVFGEAMAALYGK